MQLHLSLDCYRFILNHAAGFPHQEICGLIGGIRQKNILYAQQWQAIDNISPGPQTQFLMDPQQQVNFMLKLLRIDQELLAIYHSHPDGNPQPSRQDIARHQYRDALLLITTPIPPVYRLKAWQTHAEYYTPINIYVKHTLRIS